MEKNGHKGETCSCLIWFSSFLCFSLLFLEIDYLKLVDFIVFSKFFSISSSFFKPQPLFFLYIHCHRLSSPFVFTILQYRLVHLCHLLCLIHLTSMLTILQFNFVIVSLFLIPIFNFSPLAMVVYWDRLFYSFLGLRKKSFYCRVSQDPIHNKIKIEK